MADGTFAVLALALGLTDMSVNYCDTGCLAGRDITPRVAVSAGNVVYQDDVVGKEVFLEGRAGRSFGPFVPTYGVSATARGALWTGAGVTYPVPFVPRPAVVELFLIPGIYVAGRGEDLGGAIEFRSGIHAAYEVPHGVRVGVVYDHRSNGDLYDANPGLETVQFRVSVPLD